MVLGHGCKALKLEPFINDRLLTEPGWYPLYAACVDLDVTLQVQVGQSGPPSYVSETGRPTYVDRVAVDFPELRIVAGHIGWPWTDEMIADRAEARQHVDRHERAPAALLPADVRALPAHVRSDTRCSGASDWPILDFPRRSRASTTSGSSADGRAAFFAGNAAAAFALDLPARRDRA